MHGAKADRQRRRNHPRVVLEKASLNRQRRVRSQDRCIDTRDGVAVAGSVKSGGRDEVSVQG